MTWPTNTRTEPYTQIGIRRLKCVRCGEPAVHQWVICAEGNYRAMCRPCDIELNRMVLEWTGHPQAKQLGNAYALRQAVLAEEEGR